MTKEEKALYDREYRRKNKAKIAENHKRWVASNKDHVAEYRRNWMTENPDKVKQVSNKAQKKYRKSNPGKINSLTNKRRASKLNATPNWLTEDDWKWTEWYYKHAQAMTETTGIIHHVDHIHPLQGENISGLHVPWNLQVIPATENLKKGTSIQ